MMGAAKKLFFIIFTILVFLEAILYLLGLKPNLFFDVELDKLKSINLKTNLYTTDEIGIYKINSELVYAKNSSVSSIESVQQILNEGEKQLSYIENKNILSDSFPELTKYLKNSTLDEDTILLNYLKAPINKEGFRSIAFNKFEGTTKKKILLLGDSFAWGLSADPIFKSFPDNLMAKGYLVYNTGISGTDPAQYAAIAKKYIPLLEPDLVILNFYVGNDFMSFDRELNKSKPHEYYTDNGFIDAYPGGRFLEVDKLFTYYTSIKSIPQTNLFNKFCAQTRVGTHILWRAFFALGIVKHDNLKQYLVTQNMGVLKKAAITKKYIEAINTESIKNGVTCLNVVIPEIPFHFSKNKVIKNTGLKRKALNMLFENYLYIHPKNIKVRDYIKQGEHFNNKGMEKFSEFIINHIKQEDYE